MIGWTSPELAESALRSLQLPFGESTSSPAWDADLAAELMTATCLRRLRPVGFDLKRRADQLAQKSAASNQGWEPEAQPDRYRLHIDQCPREQGARNAQNVDELEVGLAHVAHLQELILAFYLHNCEQATTPSACTVTPSAGVDPTANDWQTGQLEKMLDKETVKALKARMATFAAAIAKDGISPAIVRQIEAIFVRFVYALAERESDALSVAGESAKTIPKTVQVGGGCRYWILRHWRRVSVPSRCGCGHEMHAEGDSPRVCHSLL